MPQPGPDQTLARATPELVRRRLDSLTGLRFFAAVLVLQHHFTNFATVPGLVAWTGFGTTGVSFFFVLSGFVLTWSWHPTDRPIRFYWRRFARIWPLHLVATLLAIPVFYGLRHHHLELVGVLLSMTMLQAWVPAATIYFAGNPAAWSLSCETFFYALHPFAVRWLLPLRPLLLGALALVITAGATAVSRGAWRLPPDISTWLRSVSPAFRVGEFLLGVLLGAGLRQGVRLPIRTAPAVALLTGWFFLYYSVSPHFPVANRSWIVNLAYGIVPCLYALIIVAAAQADLTNRRSLLRHPYMVRLGSYSYALYLVHATVIYALVAEVVPPAQSYTNLLWLAGVTGACVVLAGLLYHFVEHPLERCLRGLLSLSENNTASVYAARPPAPALSSVPE